MVADFRDAFFIVPNARSERHFFVVKYRGKYIIMLMREKITAIIPTLNEEENIDQNIIDQLNLLNDQEVCFFSKEFD